MRRDNTNKKSGTTTVRVVCAVCFWLFSFIWLYAFQSDVLAISQHVLSEGVTHYNRLVGAIFITLVLYILQLVVYFMTRLSRNTHALTYLPSMLILAVVSDFNFNENLDYTLGTWAWIVPLVLVLWIGCVWLSKQMSSYDNQNNVTAGFFSPKVWQNVLLMLGMMFLVTLMSNTNAVFHYQTHAEISLLHGDDDEALRVGERSLETNPSLTMLRAFALSRKGEMGEHFFEYAIEGNSADMLPLKGSRSRLMILPADTIYKHLGGRPKIQLDIWQYLNALERDTLATRAVADYVLCGYLVDKKLSDFVRVLPKYYGLTDSTYLPRHYREALVLYRSNRGDTAIIHQDSILYEKWRAIRDLKKEISNPSARRVRALEKYRGSYFYYYLYQ